jgi:hypothetical protein
MFAQVACLVCGKPFQVAREKLGQTVPCPWCDKPTDAVPAAVEVQPLPVSEDLTPHPPLRSGEGEKTRRPRPLLLLAYGAVLLLVAGGVFVGLRLLGGTTFTEFVAPDGSCRAVLPGTARPVPVGFSDELFPSGKRFVSTSGLGRVHGEVGWFDLPAEDAKLIRPEDLLDKLREWRAGELGAEVEKQGSARLDKHPGAEVQFVKDKLKYVERYVFVKSGPTPRVYWVSVGGENFDPDSADARKVMGSLEVGKKGE